MSKENLGLLLGICDVLATMSLFLMERAHKNSPWITAVLLAVMAALSLSTVHVLLWFWVWHSSLAERIWRVSLVTAIVLLAVGRFGIWVWPESVSRDQSHKSSETKSLGEIRIARLHSLDRNERQLLKSMYDRDTRTTYCDSFNPTVLGLIKCGVLRFSARIVPVHRAPIMITDEAWDYLHKYPELLLEPKNLTS
jgi:hypothetical protein